MARGLLQGFAVDESGNVLAGASITITHTLTAASATLYDSRTAGSTVSNPLTADANGQWSVFVDAGLYTTVVTSGAYSETVSHLWVSEVGEREVGTASSTDIPDRAAADARYAVQANDLSDLASASTARTNLGLGTMATGTSGTGASEYRTNTQNESAFLQPSNNLSDINTASTARANLGLGSSDSPTFTGMTSNTVTVDTGTFDTVVITGDAAASPIVTATITWQDDATSPETSETLQYTGGDLIYSGSYFSIGNETDPNGLLCVQGNGSDTLYISLKDVTDVSHNFTTQTEADTFGSWRKHSATEGGTRTEGFSEASNAGLAFYGYRGTIATGDTADGAILFRAYKNSGSTAIACSGSDTSYAFKNGTNAGVTFKGDGSIISHGSYIECGGIQWHVGSGTPESAVTAPVGSFYSRTDGGASTSFYVKESGTGNTGWVAK